MELGGTVAYEAKFWCGAVSAESPFCATDGLCVPSSAGVSAVCAAAEEGMPVFC